MLARYRGAGEKQIEMMGKKLIFTNEWMSIENIRLFDHLAKFPTVFDVVCFFDLKPFRILSKHIRFNKNLIITANPAAVRKLKKIAFVREQAYRKTAGEWIFRITNYNSTDLVQLNKIQSMINVLIFRELGGLGDVIMTSPIVESIKKQFPNYKITYACPEKLFPIIQNNQFAYKVLPLTSQLTQDNWDTTVDLTRDCIKYEIDNQPDVKYNRPEIFAQKCGMNFNDLPRPKIFLTEGEIEKAKQELLGKGGLKIGLVLKSNAPVRNWNGFSELRKKLIEKYKSQDVLFLEICEGKPKDWQSHKRSHPVFGRPLREVAALINECDLVISPDTGPAHIAAALRIPTLWIFTHIDGKIRTKGYDLFWVCQNIPKDCPSNGKPCWYDIPCSRQQIENKANPPCSEAVSPDMVFKQAKKILKRPSLTYCIVYNNRSEITRECLSRISKYKKYNEEVILVDNGSVDEPSHHTGNVPLGPLSLYIRNEENFGCVKARNQAMKQAKGRFILTLDNDQYISAHTVHSLLNVEGDIVGTEAWSMDKDGWAFDIKEEKGPLVYVGAGGMLVKKEVAEKLDYFNEIYSPAWFEDPDFCFKAKRAGFSINYHSNPGITHLAHQTISVQKDFDSQKIWKRNHKIFVEKWLKKGGDLFDYLTMLFPKIDYAPVNEMLSKPMLSINLLSWLRVDKLLAALERLPKSLLIPVNLYLRVQGAEKLSFSDKKKIRYRAKKFNDSIVEFTEGNAFSAGPRREITDKILENWDTPYMLTLDDDMVISKGTFELLIAFLETHKKYGAASIWHTKLNNTTQVVNGKLKSIPLKVTDQKIFDLQVMGSATMITRMDLFKNQKIAIDPDYVLGLWDYDLCLQIKMAGYALAMITSPNAMAHNDSGGSDEYKGGRYNREIIKKSVKYFEKKWCDKT